jgi:2-succinyl-6-hydroxy-2,4-cyclohexadiene-1-carboxylate synthase
VQASPIVSLHAEREGDGPAVVLVHGFTQTRDCWDGIPSDLARDHTVVRVDAPGHGRSSEVRAGLHTAARLIADQGGRAAYVGYSMGARMCLHLALADPARVTGLVLIGGTPGIEDDLERSARAAHDRALAQRVREIGVPAFVDEWLTNPLFATLPAEARYVEHRRGNTIEGLADSLERAGTGVQESLWDELPRLSMPVLAVAGALDARFAAIAARTADAIGPSATVALIPDAGHTAHLEQPAAFLATLRAWFRAHHL